MDYYVNSKSEEATIYEIYKSCRLCGAGAGYKMPIIQNVINLDPDETELKQKIRECVQIEVHQDDKMPPLICELCVDKVNDFYEFLEMCKQTNKKTRLRLGLPPQTLPRGAPDAGDCILGLTEPVFINESSNETPSSRSAKTPKAVKTKKEMEPKVNPKFRKKEDPKTPKLSELRNDVKITRSAESKKDVKITRSAESKDDLHISRVLAESSSLRSGRSRQPSPPRSLRGTKRPSEDNTPVSKVQKTNKPEATPSPKSIIKKIKQEVPDDLLEPRNKRPRDSTRETIETPKKEVNKKAKVTLNIPKIKVEPKPAAPSPPPVHKCTKCKSTFKTPQALSSHMNTHIQVKVEKIETPKPEPKPKTQKCPKCDKTFPATAFKDHKCKQPECKFCKKKFQTMGPCTNHEKFCSVGNSANTTPAKTVSSAKTNPAKSTPVKSAPSKTTPAKITPAKTTPVKTTPAKTIPAKTTPAKTIPAKTISSAKTSLSKKLKIPQWLKSQLLPMEVRLMRCDRLCDDNGHCRDADFVDHDYGLDKTREYPYLYNLSMLTHKLRIKSELAMYDRMVKIQDNIRDEFDLDEFYTHWDSASDSDSDTEMFKPKSKSAVKRLSTLSLKVLFSPKGLGKVPKKLRKIKSEKPFDSILNSTELDSDKFGISNIINSLDDSINDNDNTKDFVNEKFKTKHDDTFFGENKGPGVKNSDFDLLFGSAGSTGNKDNLSSNEDVERGSPSLDISSVNNRLSRADRNKEFNVEDKNNSVSSTENTNASIENESNNKSESDSIDMMSSNQTSVVVSKNKTQDEDQDNEFKENMIENGEDKSLTPNSNDEKLNSSTESTALENGVREKSNELIADKDVEHDKANDANDTVNSNNGSEVVNCSVNGDKDKNVDDLGAGSDTDMDDGKLMEAIDAQLGESDVKRAKVTDNLSSKESDDFTKDIEF
ncbi:nucleolar protein dao-5-like isoform X2 [Aricia agestis]|uniref:nucleolar protein dao-5-like isoform X2 n=1 Tax=Aricia agestis TaxID=91739 RepID=UPI001C20BA86|nr:nucleolar protein dao-5-like isoform X2 [Aricia agestis]